MSALKPIDLYWTALSRFCDYPHAEQIRNKTDENTGYSRAEEYTYHVIIHCETDNKGGSYYLPVDYAKNVFLSEELTLVFCNLEFRKYIGLISLIKERFT